MSGEARDTIAKPDPRVLSRECGACTLCCKVMSISELGKPQGVWCQHIVQGHGCGIYSTRPSECATFYCGYLTSDQLGEHWRPSRSKMVVTAELNGRRIAIQVDPGFPSAWRNEPFYTEIKHMARLAAGEMAQVVVMIVRRAVVILPDRDVDLGVVTDDDRIITSERRRLDGHLELDALKLRYDDPRLTGMVPGTVYRN